MSRKQLLLIVIALATAGMASAQAQESQLSFRGGVSQQACNPASPMAGLSGGMAACGTGASRAVYTESVTRAHQASGVAMLDYFVVRPDDVSKYVVTREYR